MPIRGAPEFARRPSRPGDADAWVAAREVDPLPTAAATFSARLTVDITPALRSRIKLAAFADGRTMAEMLRDLLTREYPAEGQAGEAHGGRVREPTG